MNKILKARDKIATRAFGTFGGTKVQGKSGV